MKFFVLASTLFCATQVFGQTSVITEQPQNQTASGGQTASFAIVISDPTCTVTWQRNGVNIRGGADLVSYTTPPLKPTDNGAKFGAVVYNCKNAAHAHSATATLTVQSSGSSVAPAITAQPANQTLMTGQQATFNVVANGTAPLAYQWHKNGVAISGATSSNYTTPATTTSDSGSTFHVVVSNASGNATSAPATLTVNSSTTPPTVSVTSPLPGATVSGTITVTASSSDSVGVASVQLQVDGSNVGSADTSAPYSFSFDTAAVSNGSHTLAAVAKDTQGNQATSVGVPITVDNQTSAATPTYANNGAGCPINQVSTNLTDFVTSYTCPLPNPTGQGNLLVLLLRYASPQQAPAFRDNVGGNTYNEAISCVDTANGHVSALYYAEGVTAGVNQITVSFPGATHYVQMAPFEFYNVAASSALDQAHCNVGSGSSVTAGTLGPLSASGDLVMQFGIVDNRTSIKSCTPATQSNMAWTLRMSMVADSEPSCGQYGIYNATASFSPSFSLNTSADYISVAAAFKAGSAGTPPPAGIRVVYVQHDDTQNETAGTVSLSYPISGNTIAVLFTSGCAGTSNTDCAYPTAISDGANSYAQVGGTIISNAASDGGNSSGGIWYAKGVAAGTHLPVYTMHVRSSGGNGNSFIMYDIAGAAASPLDTHFGNNGLASVIYDQAAGGSGGDLTTFTATPSGPNEVILSTAGAAWDTFTGITSPSGAQFLSADYLTETNPSHCDLNGGWGMFYNGASTAPETWIWSHDVAPQRGVGAGIALGAAFLPGP